LVLEGLSEDQTMENFLKRVLLAAAIVLVVSLAAPPAHTLPVEQQPATWQADSTGFPAQPAAQRANEAQMPASGEVTTQELKSFSGIIVKENNAVTLQDPVTKVSYRLNDAAMARPYAGKRVKVTGKLDSDSNTILVASIEIVS
jgi:hypothetical protein